MKRPSAKAPRTVLSNWKGFPCPACAQPLQYLGDEAGADGKTVRVLLVCPIQHCWQEELSLDTLHSSLFVERRRDLEADGVAAQSPRRRPSPP